LSLTFCKYFFAEVLILLLEEEPESVSSSVGESGLGVGFTFFFGNLNFLNGFLKESELPEVEVLLLFFLGNLNFLSGFLEELESSGVEFSWVSSSFSMSPNVLDEDVLKNS